MTDYKVSARSASCVLAGHGVYPLLGPAAVDEVPQELLGAELLPRAPINGGNVVIIRIVTQDHVKCTVNQRHTPVRLGLKCRLMIDK